MLARTWTTQIPEGREIEYDASALSRSRWMFEQQPGCLGVLFLRAGASATVVSFWKDQESIDALASSDSYRQTASALVGSGAVGEPFTVTVFDVTGGFLAPSVIERLGVSSAAAAP